MKICEKCQGSMVMERAVDLEVGLSILYFACLNCEDPWSIQLMILSQEPMEERDAATRSTVNQ
jgi:hypothetical protein